MENITIKKADNSFVEDIAELEKLCFYPPWSPAQIESEINKESATFLVCICDGKFAGYVSGDNIAGELYIGNIAVKKEYQGNGIGTQILQDVLEKNKCDKIRTILQVFKDNPAINLYKRLGFIIYDETDTHYRMEVNIND